MNHLLIEKIIIYVSAEYLGGAPYSDWGYPTEML